MGVSGLEYHAYVAQANFHLPFFPFTPVFVINYIFFTSLFFLFPWVLLLQIESRTVASGCPRNEPK